jgi:hypothetical protein
VRRRLSGKPQNRAVTHSPSAPGSAAPAAAAYDSGPVDGDGNDANRRHRSEPSARRNSKDDKGRYPCDESVVPEPAAIPLSAHSTASRAVN